MVDSSNLQASADVRVSAVILIFVSLASLFITFKSIRNLIYKQAQLLLIPIYLLPPIIGWLAWIQILETKDLRIVEFILSLVRAVCLASFLLYIQRMLGWVKDQNTVLYSENKLIQNLITNRSPQCRSFCFNIRRIDSEKNAKWYLSRIRLFILQSCATLSVCTVVGIVYVLASKDPTVKNEKGAKLFSILSSINSASSVVALVALLNFCCYADSLEVQPKVRFFHKLIIIKLGLIFTEIQPLIVTIFASLGLIASKDVFSQEEIVLYTNSLLLVSEMVVMSLLVLEVFPLSDFKFQNEGNEMKDQTHSDTKINI